MQEDFVGQVAILNALICRRLDHLLQPLALSEINYYYLMIIEKTPGVSQSGLATRIVRDQSSITRQVDRLAKQGWIEKRRSANDGRQSALYLTAKGTAILPQLHAITEQVNREALATLPIAQQKKFQQLLYDTRQNFINRK